MGSLEMSGSIILVDTREERCESIKTTLQEAFYDVEQISDISDAMLILLQGHADILFLASTGIDDNTLIKAVRRLKSNPETEHLPILLSWSGQDNELSLRVKIALIRESVDRILEEPYSDSVLLASLRSIERLRISLEDWILRKRTTSNLVAVERQRSSSQDENIDGSLVLITGSSKEYLKKTLETVGVKGLVIDEEITSLDTISGDAELVVIDASTNSKMALAMSARIVRLGSSAPFVLMLLAKDDHHVLVQALDLGVSSYAFQPVDKEELVERCRSLIYNRRRFRSYKKDYERSIEMVLTDGLTGLYNRLFFENHMGRLFSRAIGRARQLSILMIDVDRFKKLNDTYGHLAGDKALQEIANHVRHSLRSFDLAARYGGEEFIVIMPETNPTVAERVAERLRRKIASRPINADSDSVSPATTISVSVSIGVTGVDHDHDVDPKDLIARADAALYKAKESGRNAVCRAV